MKRITIYILLCVCTLTAYAQTYFEKGNNAYAAEHYQAAATNYALSIEKEGTTPQVLYNLGNAYYRSGQLGMAILYYERALRLDPSMEEATKNLEFANSQIQDRPDDGNSFLGGIFYGIRAWLSPSAWAWTAFTLFIITLALAALYIFSTNTLRRKTGFFGGIVTLLFTLGAATLAYSSASAANDHSQAIVTATSTVLCSQPKAPGETSGQIVPIHEGTKVTITDSIATPDDPYATKWYEVKVGKTTRAWLRASDIERI